MSNPYNPNGLPPGAPPGAFQPQLQYPAQPNQAYPQHPQAYPQAPQVQVPGYPAQAAPSGYGIQAAPPGFAQGVPAGLPPMQTPAGMNLGVLAGMNQAQAFARGNYFDHRIEGVGCCLCKITEVIIKATRKSGDSFICGLQVEQIGSLKIEVGAKRSWVQPFKDRDVAFSNILGLAAAVYGKDQSNAEELKQINEQIAPRSQELTADAVQNGSWNGRFVWVHTIPHETKAKVVITRLRFSPAK